MRPLQCKDRCIQDPAEKGVEARSGRRHHCNDRTKLSVSVLSVMMEVQFMIQGDHWLNSTSVRRLLCVL